MMDADSNKGKKVSILISGPTIVRKNRKGFLTVEGT